MLTTLESLKTKSSIEAQPVEILVDTGAGILIVSVTIAQKVKLPLEPSRVRLTSTSGQDMKVIGKVKTKIKLGIDSNYQFVVVEGLTQEVILEIDWLKENGIVIDVSKNILIDKKGKTIELNRS